MKPLYPDSYVLQVIQSIKAGEKGITVGGKTKNVFRLIPIPDKSPVIITITGLFLFVSKDIYYSNLE